MKDEHEDDLMQIYDRINRSLDSIFRSASPLDADGRPKRWRFAPRQPGADEALDLINKRMED